MRFEFAPDVSVIGERDYSMRVVLDVDRMTSLGLTPSDVVAALGAQNVQAAIGWVGVQPLSDDSLIGIFAIPALYVVFQSSRERLKSLLWGKPKATEEESQDAIS